MSGKLYPHQFRLLLFGFAYTQVERIRHFALDGTELANAKVNTIRLKVFDVDGVVVKNSRKVKIMLSSAFAFNGLFNQVANALNSG